MSATKGFGAPLRGQRGPDGARGVNGKDGLPGANGVNGKDGAAGKDGTAGANGSNGKDGSAGAAGATLIGSVTLGQTATVAVALGIREITVALAGTTPGARYQAFATNYKLNGGQSVAGRPPGYAIIDCTCNAAGQITVSLNAPLLAIGQSYAITCDVVRLNT